jgi:hypothetical protein
LVLALVAATAGPGCGWGERKPPAKSSAHAAAQQLGAREMLRKLLDTYRQAESYADDGVVLLKYEAEGRPYSETFPAAVKFARPNHLSLAAFQAIVKCDGKQLRAKIDDPLTSNVDHQFLVRPAPTRLQSSDLAADALLYDIISSRLQRPPIQLELLLDSGGLAEAFGDDVACRLLDRGTFEGSSCYRIEVPSPGGPFVFWIDERESLLRKLEYPAAALLPELAGDPQVSKLSLEVELRGAKINPTLGEAVFQLEIPANAKRMKSFVVPPQPLPTKLFGQQLAGFHFLGADGKRITSDNLRGEIAVLVWFHDHPACAATLAQVYRAQQAQAKNENVVFLAVATDPASVPTAGIEQRLKQWQAELPLARDLEAFGDKIFKIEMQPAITVLDEKGRLQVFQTGGNPDLAEQLGEIIARLEKKDDLAAEILARAKTEQAEYEKLVAAGGPEPGQVIELAQAVIKQRRQPEKLKLKEAWTNRELKSPGNIYFVPGDIAKDAKDAKDEAEPHLLVVEGWRTVTEVDAAGAIVARHTLDLPERAAITYLRTTTDSQGKRFYLASASLAPQCFVFDEAWQRVLSYPAENEIVGRLCDVQFADLDGDGPPEILAGFVDQVGLHAVGIDGKLRWRNRDFPNVISIARTPENDVGSWSILLTGDIGTVLRVNKFGNADRPIKVSGWPIMRLAAASFPNASQAEYLAISSDSQGQIVAVGLNRDLAESWNYPLPGGAHQKPIEPIASGSLLPDRAGEWLLAAPDGSIHILSDDGEFHDVFQYGAALNGIAAARFGDKPFILVATDEGLTAWEVE